METKASEDVQTDLLSSTEVCFVCRRLRNEPTDKKLQEESDQTPESNL